MVQSYDTQESVEQKPFVAGIIAHLQIVLLNGMLGNARQVCQ